MKDLETEFDLSAQFKDVSQYSTEELEDEEGYKPYISGLTQGKKFLIVRRVTTRSSGRGRGQRPDFLKLEVYELSEVDVKQYRRWKEDEDTELEEIGFEELFRRISDSDQEFITREDIRGDK